MSSRDESEQTGLWSVGVLPPRLGTIRPMRRVGVLIVVGLAIALTPIGLYDYVQLRATEQERIVEAQTQLSEAARTVHDKIVDVVDASREMLVALSQVPSLRGENLAACDRTIKSIGREFVDKYTNFSVVDETRHIVCSSGPLPKPVDVTKSPNISEAFRTGRFAISPFKFGVLTGKPILVFSLPLKNEAGSVAGTINNGLDLSWLSDYLAELDIPAGAAITVFADDGRVIAHHPDDHPAPGETIAKTALLSAALDGATRYVGMSGGERLLGVAGLPSVPGGVHVAAHMSSLPLKMAIRQEIFHRLIVLLGILAAGALVVLLGAQVIVVNPLRKLMAAADRLAEGDMGVRSGIDPTDGEVGHLGACFDRMADALAQREAALRRSIDDLGRSNAELERFAYVASHDLQEPLRTIISYTQMLERDLGSKLTEEHRDHMAFVVDGARRMRQLVTDLLEYSRVGSRVAPMAPVDMNDLTRAVLRSLEESLRESEAEVTVVNELPEVCGDASQISLVLQNLIANAIKYRRPDRVPRVSVTAGRTNGSWLFRIEDNGIGIDAQYRDAVFEVFRRLHGPDTYQGTGIGLAIVKRIVERHRGGVWIEDAPEGGAAFCFTLPARDHGPCGCEENAKTA